MTDPTDPTPENTSSSTTDAAPVNPFEAVERDLRDEPEGKQALALWSFAKVSIDALTRAADEGGARNYMSIKLEGMRSPFDRAEVFLIRPGGMSPHEAKEAAERLAESRRVALLRREEQINEVHAQLNRAMLTNADIALLMSDRMMAGQVVVDGTFEGEPPPVDPEVGLRGQSSEVTQHRGLAAIVVELRLMLDANRRAARAAERHLAQAIGLLRGDDEYTAAVAALTEAGRCMAAVKDGAS